MGQGFKKWTVLLVSVATVGLASLIYLPFNKGNEVAISHPSSVDNPAKAVEMVSAWDTNIRPYTGTSELTVYRSPSCGCCGEWVKHMERHGFRVKDIQTEDMEAIKQEYGVPQDLTSCHTAVIDGYAIEGHIPADDVKSLLQQKPNVAGLAVPGMPLGSPGMESGDRKQAFAVMAFNENGESEVFQEHLSY